MVTDEEGNDPTLTAVRWSRDLAEAAGKLSITRDALVKRLKRRGWKGGELAWDSSSEDADDIRVASPRLGAWRSEHIGSTLDSLLGFDAWAETPIDDDTYRVIVLPDMQVPYEDKATLRAVEQYIADNRWDEWLCLGDFLDLDCISSHNKGKPRLIEGKTLEQAYAAGNTILDRHQALIRKNNPSAKFTLLEGNHEYRAERYIDEHPQLAGTAEVEIGLRLRQRGIEWVRCYKTGEDYVIGKAHFHHGQYHGANHAKKHVEAWGAPIFVGHNHDVLTWPIRRRGDDSVIVGQSCGCLCEYEQAYIRQAAKNWQQAIVEFRFFRDGRFNYWVHMFFDHRFVAPDGKVYDGKAIQ